MFEYVPLTFAHGGISCTPVHYTDPSDVEQPSTPRVWHKYVHVNGTVYYYHPEKRIITRDNMEDSRMHTIIMAVYEQGMKAYEETGVFSSGSVKDDAQVHIEYIGSEEDIPEHIAGLATDNESEGDENNEDEGEDDLPATWCFICHNSGRHVSCPISQTGADIIISENTHVYWTLVEHFPMHLGGHANDILPRAKEAFLSAIAYLSDLITLKDSDVYGNVTSEQIGRFLEMYDDLLESANTNSAVIPTLLWFMASVIKKSKETQEAVGQQCRVPNDGLLGYAIPRPPEAHTTKASPRRQCFAQSAYFLLSCLFFASNVTYRRRLQETRCFSSAQIHEFRRMICEFIVEWTDSTLLATVFVGANVTFLSFGDINSLQRTVSALSTILSLLSVVSGLYHTWRHRTKVNAVILDAVKYLYHVQGPNGLGAMDESDPLIMCFFLAVPIVALQWAVACFVVALSAYCVQSTSAADSILLIILIGVASAISAFVVIHSLRHS